MRLRSLRLFAFTALITPAAVVACQGTRFDLAEDPLPSGSDSGTADATMSDAEDAGNDAEESPSDAGDAAIGPRCKRSASFGAPSLVPGLVSGAVGLRLLPDELTGYYHLDKDSQIYRVTRATRTAAFEAPTKIALKYSTDPAVDAGNHVLHFPTVTGDDSVMYLSGDFSIYRAYRDAGTFGPLTPIPELTRKDPVIHWGSFVSENGSFVAYTAIDLAAGQLTMRASTVTNGAVSAPGLVDGGGAGREGFLVLTADGTSAYFTTTRESDGGGRFQIWMSGANTEEGKLPTLNDPAPVVELRDLSSDRTPTWVSQDNCRLYFMSDAPDGGGQAMYVAERTLE